MIPVKSGELKEYPWNCWKAEHASKEYRKKLTRTINGVIEEKVSLLKKKRSLSSDWRFEVVVESSLLPPLLHSAFFGVKSDDKRILWHLSLHVLD